MNKLKSPSEVFLSNRDFQFMNHFIRIVIPFTVHENVVEDVVETSATLSKKLSVTPRTIQRDLDTLQRLGVIYRVGSDKDGHWEVNAKQRKNE